jgi:hypothetical protein
MNKEFYMEPSDKKTKKWQITYINKDTGRPNTIYFGQKPYQDFTQHKTLKRKNLYIQRHSGMGEDWKDPETAGFYSRWILWNLPDLEDSIKDTEKRFGIKIHLITK